MIIIAETGGDMSAFETGGIPAGRDCVHATVRALESLRVPQPPKLGVAMKLIALFERIYRGNIQDKI
jgi:hypothetical protein